MEYEVKFTHNMLMAEWGSNLGCSARRRPKGDQLGFNQGFEQGSV